MLEGIYRGSIRKIGPRVLTFATDNGAIPAALQSNCPRCASGKTGLVFGEKGSSPALPLVHGWYTFQSSVYCYVMQLGPVAAVSSSNPPDPVRDGRLMSPCEDFDFFVDDARRDGILVVQFCQVSEMPNECVNGRLDDEGLARVVRLDTIASMADTGENADLPSPPSSRKCDPK